MNVLVERFENLSNPQHHKRHSRFSEPYSYDFPDSDTSSGGYAGETLNHNSRHRRNILEETESVLSLDSSVYDAANVRAAYYSPERNEWIL